MAEAEESAQIEEESVVVKKKEFKEVPDDQGKKDNLPSDNRACTIVTMVLCGLILNVFAFFCLIPAYCYSLKVSIRHLYKSKVTIIVFIILILFKPSRLF
jgi:hypothetical protein